MARGRWLKKMANRAQNRFEQVQEFVDSAGGASALSGQGASIDFSNLDMGSTINTIRERGKQCSDIASDTIELCDTTAVKSQRMVDFGSTIQSTLQSFSNGPMDASALEIIRDLTDGAKLEQAAGIAVDMKDVALGCVDKSIQIIDLMEDSMDDLPDSLEQWIDKMAENQKDESEDEALLSMKNLDKDIEEVQNCITEMKHLNITSAFQIGLKAFEQLSAKAQLSRSMFDSIKRFSTSVRDISQDLGDMDVISLSSKIRDILKCIRLSEVMRAFAEGVKKIIQVLIDLFKATAERISALWAALAFAKECMSDCLEHVIQAKSLVMDAHDKSVSLLEKSQTVWGQLNSIKGMNRQTFAMARELSQGDEIPDAIELANGMDELVADCSSKVVSMIDRVSEGFQNLPDIITDGIDLETSGKDDQDPQPRGVEEDITELETSREAMESSDIFTACKSGASAFSSVSKKSEVCSDMLLTVRDFAVNCDGTIESFLGTWDLESVVTKIQEMCRLVSLGELMKQFASQLQQLATAMVALMRAALAKLSSLDISELGDQMDDMVGDAIGSVVGEEIGDMVGEKVGMAMGKMTSKFGKMFK